MNNHEERMKAISRTRQFLLDAMEESTDNDELTALEWCAVFHDLMTFILREGLRSEHEQLQEREGGS